jgi:hypothetical protein
MTVCLSNIDRWKSDVEKGKTVSLLLKCDRELLKEWCPSDFTLY